jgi:alkylated DNA nucleotide flippase Atl1
MGEKARSPIARQVSASDGRLRSLSVIPWARVLNASALRISQLGGGWSSLSKVAKGEEAMEPNRAPRVPLRSDGLELARHRCGPQVLNALATSRIGV